MTPPASLFSRHRDWEALSKENTAESKKELYRWIEYWKLRFTSRTYTPLTNPDGKYPAGKCQRPVDSGAYDTCRFRFDWLV